MTGMTSSARTTLGLIALSAAMLTIVAAASDTARSERLADAAEPPYRLVGYALAGGPEPEPLRLRKFDADALGIVVTPGNSAASLAGLLESLSDRRAAVGSGPSLILASKPVTLDRLLGRGGSRPAWPGGKGENPG